MQLGASVTQRRGISPPSAMATLAADLLPEAAAAVDRLRRENNWMGAWSKERPAVRLWAYLSNFRGPNQVTAFPGRSAWYPRPNLPEMTFCPVHKPESEIRYSQEAVLTRRQENPALIIALCLVIIKDSSAGCLTTFPSELRATLPDTPKDFDKGVTGRPE